jgi:two-component system, OmpR family, aerobic respiration control sensor histidine kinase ArcB
MGQVQTDDPVASALGRLLAAVDGLEDHARTPAATAELAVLRSSALRLAGLMRPTSKMPSGLRDFDAAQFEGLLQMAGPEIGGELVMRLQEDLTAAKDIIDVAGLACDWPRLKGASHVLISLGGSVGARSLQGLAETLNKAAHAEEAAAVPALRAEVLGELEALLRIVAETRVSTKDPP